MATKKPKKTSRKKTAKNKRRSSFLAGLIPKRLKNGARFRVNKGGLVQWFRVGRQNYLKVS